jgi:hypothetical protein
MQVRTLLFFMVSVTSFAHADDAPAIYQTNEQFTNALANTLTVTLECTPNTLRDDEFTTLRLTLRGMSNPTRVRRPPLGERSEWTALFRNISDGATQLGDQEVAFEYRLQPRTHGRLELPTIQLDYFAPASQQFRTKYTDPLPIIVSPSQLDATPPTPRPAVVVSEPSVLQWLMMFTSILGGTGAYVLVWRWRNPDGVRLAKLRRNRAVRRVWRALDAAEPNISLILREYLIERHHLTVTATVPSEIAACLCATTMSEARIDEVGAILEACDASRFSPQREQRELANAVRELVMNWEAEDALDRRDASRYGRTSLE